MKTPDDVRDWVMSYGDLSWQCRWSPYRHVGVFPEQALHWDWTREIIRKSDKKEIKVTLALEEKAINNKKKAMTTPMISNNIYFI